MVREAGFEPATTRVSGEDSDQLSYSRMEWTKGVEPFIDSFADRPHAT